MRKSKKVNILMLLVALLIISCAFAQTKSVNPTTALKEQISLLQLPHDFEYKKDTTGFTKFKNSKFYSKNGEADVFSIIAKNVHLVDFNNDGLKDIIYQEQQLHKAIVLFANNGKDFIEIWDGPGEVVFIKQAEKTTISVYTPYVGCIEINLLFEVTIGANNEIVEDLLSYHHNTQITNLNPEFKQKEVTGMLRTTPVVDDSETKDPCTGEPRPGNQIRAIENQRVTVIKDQGDWSLVVYKSYNNSIIAWIKSN
ncbi:hypothetical protein [Aurantibacter sp.]|uniref:hypothetical protein n=1 Tax=Aurantibacter sp. TaxID=2807103 RepID=UPI003266989C